MWLCVCVCVCVCVFERSIHKITKQVQLRSLVGDFICKKNKKCEIQGSLEPDKILEENQNIQNYK